MAKYIGRLVNVGIGKETVRGTGVAPTYYLPKMELTFDDKIEQVIDESSLGIIADADNANVTGKYSEGELKGKFDDTAFGLWLLATLGVEPNPPVLVGGETIVYDHTFEVANDAQHPSLTFSVQSINEDLQFPLAMVDSLEINVEINKYAEYTVAFRANSQEAGASMPTYTDQNVFLPQNAEFKFANTVADLGSAPTVPIRKLTFSIAKNIEDDRNIGNVNATDRLNKQMAIEGTVELLWDSATDVSPLMLADTAQAIQMKLYGTTTLGVASLPEVTFILAKCKFSEVARNQANNDLILQTLSFKAFYDFTEEYQIKAIIRNLVATQY